MKHLFIWIAFIILLTACSPRKPELISLEFIDFNWSVWDAKTSNEVPKFFKCHKYAYINKDGQTTLYVYKNSHPIAFNYFKGQIDPILIQNFESLSRQANKAVLDSLYFDFINLPSDPNGEPPRIYDGTFIKVRSNYADGSSIIYNLVDDYHSPMIKPLYDTIFGIAKGTNFYFGDIEKLDSINFNFIKDACEEDLKFRLKTQLPKSLQIKKPIRILKKDTIVYLPK